jgi:hypothetical protein
MPTVSVQKDVRTKGEGSMLKEIKLESLERLDDSFHLLKENQSTASVRPLPDILKAAHLGQSEHNHAHKSANHENKLERVRPHDRLEAANRGVENADHARGARDDMEIDSGDLRKRQRRNVTAIKEEDDQRLLGLKVSFHSHNCWCHDDAGNDINRARHQTNASIEPLLEVLKRRCELKVIEYWKIHVNQSEARLESKTDFSVCQFFAFSLFASRIPQTQISRFVF